MSKLTREVNEVLQSVYFMDLESQYKLLAQEVPTFKRLLEDGVAPHSFPPKIKEAWREPFRRWVRAQKKLARQAMRQPIKRRGAVGRRRVKMLGKDYHVTKGHR